MFYIGIEKPFFFYIFNCLRLLQVCFNPFALRMARFSHSECRRAYRTYTIPCWSAFQPIMYKHFINLSLKGLVQFAKC